jgi:hypothetical protein
MARTDIKLLTSSVTPDDMARLTKAENLMQLKTDIDSYRQGAVAGIRESIERRRAACLALGADVSSFNELLIDLDTAFDKVRSKAEAAQYRALMPA